MDSLAFLLAGALLGPVNCEVTPCEVRDGECRCVLDTSNTADDYVLILGSLAPWNQSCTIRLRGEPTKDALHVPREKLGDEELTRAALTRRKRQLTDSRKLAGQPDQFAPLAAPPRNKTFHLFVGARDLDNPDQYHAVAARLHSFNKVAQVYVDVENADNRDQDATAAEVLRTFEEDVLPWVTRFLGKADDVDRDGRFTFFLTGQIARMRKGKTRLDGFTRGSDFFLELSAPFSNRCDMVVLHRDLRPGPHLRTVLLHEFTHAVSFCGHALRDYPTGPRRQDDETWLSESLAHLVEDIRGFSRSNLEERVRAYLAAPQENAIVIPDTFAAGMWRTPGVRGGGFLFLRHVYQQTGPALLYDLAQSNLRGKENLETAAEHTFPSLFRSFGVELAKRAFAVGEKNEPAWEGAAKAVLLSLNGEQIEARLAGSALCFIRLSGGIAPRSCVTIRSLRGIPLQATLVRLPRNP